MEQRKFSKQVERLTNEQVKVKDVITSHRKYIQDRQLRLDQLALEFKTCRASLARLEPTPDNLRLLWEKSELFKEELLEISELLNEYFRRSKKRLNRTNDALQRHEQLSKAKVTGRSTSCTQPTNNTLISNPFHL